ncbi:YpmS family protein [Companilactobacillus sp. DQM5]|uniref:YpmS family protein n=1 Tax=Companilactobacillus sp. DQM5 TaxID=3463359 RepID=UPI0040595E84
MKKRNWWKISFIILISLIFIIGAFLGFKIMNPEESNAKVKTANKMDKSAFLVTLNKKQANKMAADYIDQFLNNDDIKYQLVLNKKHAEVTGKVKFIGSKIKFTLIMNPYRSENGDIILETKKLKVGSLSIPINFVMNYIENTYHLPDWVKLNSKKRTINLQLTKFKTESGYSFKVRQLDLKNDVIKVEVFKKGK